MNLEAIDTGSCLGTIGAFLSIILSSVLFASISLAMRRAKKTHAKSIEEIARKDGMIKHIIGGCEFYTNGTAFIGVKGCQESIKEDASEIHVYTNATNGILQLPTPDGRSTILKAGEVFCGPSWYYDHFVSTGFLLKVEYTRSVKTPVRDSAAKDIAKKEESCEEQERSSSDYLKDFCWNYDDQTKL